MTLRVIARFAGGTTSLDLDGDLDISTHRQLEPAIQAALQATPSGGRVVIDLTGVTFLDCATIGVLLHARHAAHSRDITFHAANAHGIVLRILQVLALHEVLSGPSTPPRQPTTAVAAAGTKTV